MTKLEDNETLEFTAEVDIKPTIDLPAYDDLTAQVDDVAVTDEDVDEQVAALRERFATLVDVERAAADGDFVVIDLVAQQDGETVEGAELTGMSYKVGRGGMLDGLDEALDGMAAGDEKAFTSQLVGGDLVGQDVEVTVKVTKVQEQQLPDYDDEFAQLASEFDTADELTADVRERLGRGKRLEQAAAARDAVLEALLERVDVPLPETVVTDELNSRRRNVEQQLAYAGITLEKYLEDEGQTEEEFEADLERRVRDAVVAQLLLDEVADQGGARRRPERALRSTWYARPAVRRGPAGVRQPHVRAQPHPRAGPGDPPGQGARADRGVGDGHRRLRQRGRAEEPASRRHHRRAGGRDRRGVRRDGATRTLPPRPSTSRPRTPPASDAAPRPLGRQMDSFDPVTPTAQWVPLGSRHDPSLPTGARSSRRPWPSLSGGRHPRCAGGVPASAARHLSSARPGLCASAIADLIAAHQQHLDLAIPTTGSTARSAVPLDDRTSRHSGAITDVDVVSCSSM